MNILLLGGGAVGEAYGVLVTEADPGSEQVQKLVVADYSLERAPGSGGPAGGRRPFSPAIQVDAGNQAQVEAAIRTHGIDLLINGCPQNFNETIFDGAFAAGCHYLDMAMTLSRKHPTEPHAKLGALLGDYQFRQHARWEEKGLLALLGMGIDPRGQRGLRALCRKCPLR